MAKRKKRKFSKTRIGANPRRGKPRTAPAPLLVLDQKPFLKKTLTQCRRLRTELHKKQERLRIFEEEEMAAYQRWFHSEFGALLTEIREMTEKASAHEFILEQMQCCALFRPEKLEEVHSELMRRLEDGTLYSFAPPEPEEEEEEDDDEEEEEDEDDGDWEEFDDVSEAFRQAFEEMFGDGRRPDAEEGDADQRRRPGKQPGRYPSPEEASIKTLYRALAKRLHPDHSDLESPMRERRWNELQCAYEERDLEGLQRIEAVCDMEVGGLSIGLGLARLRDLAAYHRSHLEPIRRALRQAKRHPAFDFEKANREVIRREARIGLSDTLDQIREKIEWIREEIDDMIEADTEETGDAWVGSAPPEMASGFEPEETVTDKDIWDNYNAWREEELRRSSAKPSDDSAARKGSGRTR